MGIGDSEDIRGKRAPTEGAEIEQWSDTHAIRLRNRPDGVSPESVGTAGEEACNHRSSKNLHSRSHPNSSNVSVANTIDAKKGLETMSTTAVHGDCLAVEDYVMSVEPLRYSRNGGI
jgi:hypothetical protein